MRHQYTRAELESITQETAIYIEGTGIAQLQWGGLEIAEGVRDGYLYCKHIKPFAMELYGKYWTAWDGPPEEETADHLAVSVIGCVTGVSKFHLFSPLYQPAKV